MDVYMRVYYVFLWVWNIDQLKLIISMDTDTDVYMVVCWLQLSLFFNISTGETCWYMLLAW